MTAEQGDEVLLVITLIRDWGQPSAGLDDDGTLVPLWSGSGEKHRQQHLVIPGLISVRAAGWRPAG